MKFLLALLIMIIFDFVLPIQVRIYGGFFRDYDSSEAFRLFRREYGLSSILRATLILGICIPIGIYDLVKNDYLVYLSFCSLLLWFIVATRDSITAKRKVDIYFKNHENKADE